MSIANIKQELIQDGHDSECVNACFDNHTDIKDITNAARTLASKVALLDQYDKAKQFKNIAKALNERISLKQDEKPYDMSTIQPTAYSGINTGEETDTNQTPVMQYAAKPESKFLKYGGWLAALGSTVLGLLQRGQVSAAEAKFNEVATQLQGNEQALGELQNLYNDVNAAYTASQQTIQQTGSVGQNFVMRDSQSGVDTIARNLAKQQFRAQQFEKFNHKYEGMIKKLNEEIANLKGTNNTVEQLLAKKANELTQCNLNREDAVRWVQLLAGKLGMPTKAVYGIMGFALGLGAGVGLAQLSRYLSSGRRYNSSYERKMNTVYGSKQDGYIPGQDSILFMEDKDIQPNYTQYIPFITPSYNDASGEITGAKGATVTSQQVADYMKPLHNDGTTKTWADEHIRGMVAQDNYDQEISDIQEVPLNEEKQRMNAIDQMVNSFNVSLGSHTFTGADDKRRIATFAVDAGWVRQGTTYVNLNDPQHRRTVDTLVQELNQAGII